MWLKLHGVVVAGAVDPEGSVLEVRDRWVWFEEVDMFWDVREVDEEELKALL